jgi:hypothetical protein
MDGEPPPSAGVPAGATTIDELLEKLVVKPGWQYCAMLVSLQLTWVVAATIVLITVFTGNTRKSKWLPSVVRTDSGYVASKI